MPALIVGLALIFSSSAMADQAAADRCLERLAAEPGTASVVPAQRCAGLEDALFPRQRPDWVSRPQPVEALRTTARAFTEATSGRRITLDRDRVGEIVSQAHIPAVPAWVRWFREWLESQDPEQTESPAWLRDLAHWIQGNRGWLLALMQGALAITVVLLTAWILAGIRWPRLRRPRGPRAPWTDAPAASAAAPRRFDAIAELDEPEQVPALLAWLVAEWERTARLPGARRMTDGQIVRRLGREGEDRATVAQFRELANAAQSALFGGRMPDSEKRRRCFQLAAELAGGHG